MKLLLPHVGGHGAILLILAAFVALGVIYSLSTPLLEGPDEMWHYPYVKYIADGRGLPRQSETGEKSEFHQPPLYYALGALVSFSVNSDDLDALMERNPYWGYEARAPGVDNKNIFVHTDRENPPYTGAVLAIRLVRWLSVLLGAVTVLGTYLVGREVFPVRRYLAVGAAALVAFTPQFLYLSGTVNNDNLTAALCTLAVWLLAGLLNGKASTARLVALGGVIGLALLTKWTALALLPLTGLVLLYRACRARSGQLLWHDGWLVLGVALLFSGWWFARSQILYGDPLGIGTKMQIFPPRDPVPTWRDLIRELPRKEVSFWACFGWENVYADPWVYTVLRAFTYIGLLGLVAFAVRRWRRRDELLLWPHLALLATWLLLVAAAFVRWMIYTEAAVGRHLFPAMSSIMLLLLWGWSWFWPPRRARVLTCLLASALFLLAAVTPFRYIQPVYAPPPRFPTVAAAGIAQPWAVSLGGQVRLIGAEVAPEGVSPGETLYVTLYWEVLRVPDRNYSVFVHVVDEGGMVAQRDSYPGLGRYPTRRWQPGEIIRDMYPVRIPVTAHAPTQVRVLTGMYLLQNMVRLPVAADGDAPPCADDAIEVGRVELLPAVTASE